MSSCSLQPAALHFSALAPFLKPHRVSFLKQENGKQISPPRVPRARRSAAGNADRHPRCPVLHKHRTESKAATTFPSCHSKWRGTRRVFLVSAPTDTDFSRGHADKPLLREDVCPVHVSDPEAINPASYVRLAAVPHEACRPHFTFSFHISPFPFSFREPTRPLRKFSAHPAQAAVPHAASPSHTPAEQSDAVHLFILFFNIFSAFPPFPQGSVSTEGAARWRRRSARGAACFPPCAVWQFGVLGFFFLNPGVFLMCLPHKQRLRSRRRGRSVRRGGSESEDHGGDH